METLERWIAQDPGGRGVEALVVPGDLAAAAAVLASVARVLVLTGFAVGPAGVAETDGPPGALFLSRALLQLGKEVAIATHTSCQPVLAAGIAALDLPISLSTLAPGEAPEGIMDAFRPGAVVAVELPGRAADGQYYNMRGLPITARTSPLDGALLLAAEWGIPTIAVGDGGNEAGMGKVGARIRSAVPRGEQIASVVPTDFLITAGTSNWGAYGLVAAMDGNLVQSVEEEVALLEALVRAGALDGVSLTSVPTVDGIDQDLYLQTLLQLRTLRRGQAAG